MNREDIIAMAREAGLLPCQGIHSGDLKRFFRMAQAAERNKVAQWMIQRSYATGHGDTVEDLLKELEWQVKEAENEACAKVCDDHYGWTGRMLACEIRNRGQA